ncbi:MAG: serine hydrolase domain-containing protein [Pseudomonadales bacterium]
MSTAQYQSSPEAVGIDLEKLEALRARARQEVDAGLLPSAQIAVARKGRLCHFETFGEADNSSLYCIFSATKAITSAAAWLLIQEGRLDITQPVAGIIPEFGDNEKAEITIEQLFLHTAGFPHAPFRVEDWNDKQRRMERFASWRLGWAPGSRYEYHPTSSMWVIGELIERISGYRYEDFIRERISAPLALDDLRVGTPEDQQARVTHISHHGDALTEADYQELGLPVPPVTEVTEDVISNFNRPINRATPVPGGGGIMTAADLALFYQALLGEIPTSGPLWSEATMALVTTPRTGDLTDQTTGVKINRGLGVVIAGDEKRNLRGFGHTNSPTTFGHQGAGGQLAWADPETGLSFVYLTNGHDRNRIREARRGISISNRAAVCAAD